MKKFSAGIINTLTCGGFQDLLRLIEVDWHDIHNFPLGESDKGEVSADILSKRKKGRSNAAIRRSGIVASFNTRSLIYDILGCSSLTGGYRTQLAVQTHVTSVQEKRWLYLKLDYMAYQHQEGAQPALPEAQPKKVPCKLLLSRGVRIELMSKQMAENATVERVLGVVMVGHHLETISFALGSEFKAKLASKIRMVQDFNACRKKALENGPSRRRKAKQKQFMSKQLYEMCEATRVTENSAQEIVKAADLKEKLNEESKLKFPDSWCNYSQAEIIDLLKLPREELSKILTALKADISKVETARQTRQSSKALKKANAEKNENALIAKVVKLDNVSLFFEALIELYYQKNTQLTQYTPDDLARMPVEEIKGNLKSVHAGVLHSKDRTCDVAFTDDVINDHVNALRKKHEVDSRSRVGTSSKNVAKFQQPTAAKNPKKRTATSREKIPKTPPKEGADVDMTEVDQRKVKKHHEGQVINEGGSSDDDNEQSPFIISDSAEKTPKTVKRKKFVRDERGQPTLRVIVKGDTDM